MGCWGIGITQSDEYCEVYDNFMEEYNAGKEVPDITASILSEYHNEFDDSDGAMHDVYFALAKAEWTCCAQSDIVLSRIKEIISSGDNIEFYRELGASESDLKKRKKILDKFLESLLVPRAKPRQRRIDTSDRVMELPPIEVGGCYAYKYENGYRIVVILDRVDHVEWDSGLKIVACAILEKTFPASEIRSIDYSKEMIGLVSWYKGSEFLGKSAIKEVAAIDIPDDLSTRVLNEDCFDVGSWISGSKKDFRRPFYEVYGKTLSEFFTLTKPKQVQLETSDSLDSMFMRHMFYNLSGR